MCNGEGYQRVLFSSVSRCVSSTAKEQREGMVGSVLGLFREDNGSKVPSGNTAYEGHGSGKCQGMILWCVSSKREARVSICLGLQGITV